MPPPSPTQRPVAPTLSVDASPRSTPSTSGGCSRPTPWTSTTSSSSPSRCCSAARTCARLPAALPPRPGRRVPGHEQGAERARHAARQGPRQRLRGGRLRPVDLPIPRRGHPQHLGLRAFIPRCHRCHVGAELPVHPDHLGRGQRGDRPQLGSAPQAAVHGRRRRATDLPLPRGERVRRGIVRRERDLPAAQRRAARLRRRCHLLPDQRPEPSPRRGARARRCSLQGRRRLAFLRPPGDQGHPRLRPAAGQPR